MNLSLRSLIFVNTALLLFKTFTVKTLEESKVARVGLMALQGAGWVGLVFGGLMLGGCLGAKITKYAQLDTPEFFLHNQSDLIKKSALTLLGGLSLLTSLGSIPKSYSECSLEVLKALMRESIRTSNFNAITQILNQRHFAHPTIARDCAEEFVNGACLIGNFEAALVIFDHPILDPAMQTNLASNIFYRPFYHVCYEFINQLLFSRPALFNAVFNVPPPLEPVIHEPHVMREDDVEDLRGWDHLWGAGPEENLHFHLIPRHAEPMRSYYFGPDGPDVMFHDAVRVGDLDGIKYVMERHEVSEATFDAALKQVRTERRYDAIKQMLLSSAHLGSTRIVKELLKEEYFSVVPHEMLEAFEIAAGRGHSEVLEAFIMHGSFIGPLRHSAALVVASLRDLKSYKILNSLSFFSSMQLKEHLQAAILNKNIRLVQYIASLRQLSPEHKAEALELSKETLNRLMPGLEETSDAFCETVFRTTNLIDVLKTNGRFIEYFDDTTRDKYSIVNAAVLRPDGRIESEHLAYGSERIQTMYRLCQEASFCLHHEVDPSHKHRLALLNKALKIALMQGF